MSAPNHLHFNADIGKQKPETIRNRSSCCPFCDRANLADILAQQGSILLVKNKYPVLQDAFQTVLIETDDCDAELSTYPKEQLYRVIRFGVEQWRGMEQSGDFASVLFYKNHGPYSGGSIHHPHMQIVGLKKIDYRNTLKPEFFEGIPIHSHKNVIFNLSTKPKIGFFEFNVILEDLSQLEVMADYIQVAAHFVLNGFHKWCNSYNLFFYEWNKQVLAKIVPRFVTTPIYVGYGIPQVSNRADDVVQAIKNRYF